MSKKEFTSIQIMKRTTDRLVDVAQRRATRVKYQKRKESYDDVINRILDALENKVEENENSNNKNSN